MATKKADTTVGYALRVLGNLNKFEERVRDTPVLELLSPVRKQPLPDEGELELLGGGLEGIGGLEMAGPVGEDDFDLPGGESPELAAERRRVVEAGRKAVTKLKKSGRSVELTPDEEQGLEAIILLTERPAILIQDGQFLPPPQEWKKLEGVRAQIEANLPRIGRIELDGHPSMEWIGTGFLVADTVVMTNRHVAKVFCKQSGKKWVFEPGMTPRIDYNEELGATRPAEFAITGVVGIHEKYDMALLTVSRKGSKSAQAPDALPVAKEPELVKKREVYVVGYPAADPYRNDPENMRRIFSGIYNVKRLQPGGLMTIDANLPILQHDCSTLGGNSGSCVIDLETHQVVGLHFGGRYRQANSAVVLSRLIKDPLVKKAKIAFA
ncbi:MAG: serine protease [Bryobacteraceae bacterium]